MMESGEDPGMQSSTTADVVSSLKQGLSSLAQPIARFQCRSELGRMLATQTALGEAVVRGLEDLCLTQNSKRVRALVAEASKGRV